MSDDTQAAGEVRRRRRSSRPLRASLTAIMLVLLAPFLIAPLYAFVPPPASSLMIGRWLSGQGVARDWVPLEEISPHLPISVLMSEDGRYCTHSGVDWGALREQLGQTMRGEEARGASTIAMQTAKNLFLWSGRSYVRKAYEVPLALWLNLVLSKRRLMEIYLNIAEWGPGVFGAQAAARHHFGKPAADLSRVQAARLAAALPNPHVFDAGDPGPRTRRIAGVIERRARAAGAYIGCLSLRS
jgi:monofunctional biosynthetic peptidoglycan transglycosylase